MLFLGTVGISRIYTIQPSFSDVLSDAFKGSSLLQSENMMMIINYDLVLVI